MSKSPKPKILIQLDTDPQPNSFDGVVAVDAGVDRIFSYGNVALDQVESLVHGAIFTRGKGDLRRTAIFIGGSNVEQGEHMLERVVGSFLGPLSVSVMMDVNGSNTTAAAAVLAACPHQAPATLTALILAGTGPVGQRAARLLAGEGVTVRLASRSRQRATAAADSVNRALSSDRVVPFTSSDDVSLAKALDGAELVIAAGAAGVELLPAKILQRAASVKVAIDLNAVPPAGIEGINVTDLGVDLGGGTSPVKAYGAIAVGGIKIKIHKAAIASLFDANDRVLDADQIYELGKMM